LRFRLLIPFACVLVLIPAVIAKADTQNIADLINQAHQHDNMYTLGPEASQQEAVKLYEAALAAGPDDKQRLHILYRMAQLYGSAYERQKGEEPDYQKAISLYKEIIDNYPPDEPLVQSAMISLAGHYTTLNQYEASLEWARKILEYDTNKLAEQIKAAEDQRKARDDYIREHGDDPLTEEERSEFKKQMRNARTLKQNLKIIKQIQLAAVDQITYTACSVDPLIADVKLRDIVEKYAGTPIGNRAVDRLEENLKKISKLWAPLAEEPTSSNSSLQSGDFNSAGLTKNRDIIQTQPNSPPEILPDFNSFEPNTQQSQKREYHQEEPRAPPQVQPLKYILICAAGLIVLAIAVVIIRRKTFS